MINRFSNNENQASLADVNTAHLLALSQQGNQTLTHAALMEQATAQAAMQEAAESQNIEVLVVDAID